MAFVPGFLHDVFISYACVDDQASGLIRHFWKELVIELQREGLKVIDGDPAGLDVFLDRTRLEAGSDLTEQVLSGARSSAVFIAFHSSAYVESSWCLREAQEFTGNYDRNRPKLEGRLFVIALGKRGNPAQSPIEALRSRRFHPFFYLHPDGRDFPFEPPTDHSPELVNSDNLTMREEIIQLAREVADTLKAMRKESPAPRVFLAHTSDAMRAQAEDIKNWLALQQALVLRASPWKGDWEAECRELIGQADLFVDLQESVPQDVAVKQAQMATDLKKRRMRWLPRGALGAEAVQLVLKETEVIEETLENFKDALRVALTRPSERYKPPAPDLIGPKIGGNDDVSFATVLLVGAQKDEIRIAQIEQKLDEIGCGRDTFLSEDVLELPDTWREKLQAILPSLSPSAVVFIDGDCSGAWADTRLRDLVMLLRDAAPMARPALCTFPPPNKPRRYRPPPGRVPRIDDTQLDKIRDLLRS